MSTSRPLAGAAARRWWTWLAVALLCLAPAPAAGQGDALQPLRDQLEAARKLHDALEYESALPALDRVIAVLGARPASDAGVRALLVSAYELRALTKFGLDNREGARQDLAALLGLDPAHKLPPKVAGALLQMFEAVRKTSVGELRLTVDPPDALVTVDGTRVEDYTVPIGLAAGPRKLMATRGGYRTAERDLVIVPGAPLELALTLERVSSVFYVFTSPAGVEVTLDGVSRGRTAEGPPPERFRAVADKLGVPLERLSAPLVVDDVGSGRRVFELRRPCYVARDLPQEVGAPGDWELPVKMELAAATVKVTSNVNGADVLLNQQKKGVTPLVIPEVCEGPQVLEVISGFGRFVTRFEARAGATEEISADVAPALALVSVAGEASRVRGEDVRLLAEDLVGPARTLTVFAPPEAEVESALKEQRLSRDWLGFDADGKPVGQADSVSVRARQDASQQLAKRFGAQGVAGVTVLSGGDGRATLSLLAAGSGQPDVVEVSLGGSGVAETVAELDAGFEVLRPAIEAVTMDIADVTGAMVVAVEAGSQAAQAGLAPGQAIVGVNGVAVASIADLVRVLATQPVDQPLPFTVIDKAGATRTVSMPVLRRPKVVSMDDRMTRFNKLVLDLRFRLTTAKDPLEEMLLRLNLGVALMSLENWSEARRELQRVRLADGPGVSNGTVQYLLGRCFEEMGQVAEADQAYKAAAAVEGSLVTEFGPTVADAIKARASRR